MIEELFKYLQANPAASAPLISAFVSVIVTVIVKGVTAMAERSKSDAENETADAAIKKAFIDSTNRQIDSLQTQSHDCIDQVNELKEQVANSAAASVKALDERDKAHAEELRSIREQHAMQTQAQQTQIEFLQAQVQRLTEIILGKGGGEINPAS